MVADRHPAQRAAAEQQRRGDDRSASGPAAELANRLRQPRIVELVLDGLAPAGRVREEVRGHALAREPALLPGRLARSPASPFGRREQPILHVRHPQVALLHALVDQPHRARVALALLDHRLRQPAEEAFDVRLAHEQIERELDDLGLHASRGTPRGDARPIRAAAPREAPPDRLTSLPCGG